MSTGLVLRLVDLTSSDDAAILGRLTHSLAESGFDTQRASQTRAWEHEVSRLKQVAQSLIERDASFGEWHLLLEYEIPRRQKRPDGILLDSDVIFVLEFKVGEAGPGAAERWQAEEYALDLRDFHAGSNQRTIIPLLCLDRDVTSKLCVSNQESSVWSVRICSAPSLADEIADLYKIAHNSSKSPINPHLWLASPYRPTLTIVEAAERLFSHHDVREISHSYAGNLTETTNALVMHIREAQARGERRICFVTGVPGAGKTLTGLNAVHDPQLRAEGRQPAVFLSGNGPLVKIIRAALVRSSQRRGDTLGEAKRRVSAFIQNVHAFLKHCMLNANQPPAENVVVFDEAQRAWDARKMFSKHGRAESEPSLVLEAMERCSDWCVLVALVGGGQEIHEGEAGLAEWGRALASRPKRWTVIAPEEALAGGSSVAGHGLSMAGGTGGTNVEQDDRLHLSVSTRSWRAHKFNEWVNSVLRLEPAEAAKHVPDIREFPVVRTRDLSLARAWLRARSRLDPNRRCGLVASSGATRLRAYGIELSTAFRRGYPFDEWFLAGPMDVRSSFRLEVAATEFEVQGLELDWVSLCWGNDFHISGTGQWAFRRFIGTRWAVVRNEIRQQYILNKYRVLLTRARQGLVIWMPPGTTDDLTLSPVTFDATFDYLGACGIPTLEQAADNLL